MYDLLFIWLSISSILMIAIFPGVVGWEEGIKIGDGEGFILKNFILGTISILLFSFLIAIIIW